MPFIQGIQAQNIPLMLICMCDKSFVFTQSQFSFVTRSFLVCNFVCGFSVCIFRSILVTKDPSSVQTARLQLQLWTPV